MICKIIVPLTVGLLGSCEGTVFHCIYCIVTVGWDATFGDTNLAFPPGKTNDNMATQNKWLVKGDRAQIEL